MIFVLMVNINTYPINAAAIDIKRIIIPIPQTLFNLYEQ